MSKAFEGDAGFKKAEKPVPRETIESRTVVRASGESDSMFGERVDRNAESMLREQKARILAETGIPAFGLKTVATFTGDRQEAAVVVYRYLGGRISDA